MLNFKLKIQANHLMVKKTKPAPTSKGHKDSKKIKLPDVSEQIKDEIVRGMQEKKGKEIVCIDLRNMKNAVTDFFVICHADSKTHVEAIADSVEEYVKKTTGERPSHKEGIANAEWILVDYFNAVAHIFNQEQREFYRIEQLWADAPIQKIASNY
jgi:ribosome-associated protein